jgi:hypothetical protein
MFGYRRTADIAAAEYERGVEDAITVMRDRGARCGGVLDPHMAEIEIRCLLLNQNPQPVHDEPRSR